MEWSKRMILALVVLAFGVLLYITSVTGIFLNEAAPPADVGLLASTAAFVLIGLGLLWSAKTQTA